MTAIRICFVGDSVTLGTGDITAQGWPGRLTAIEGMINEHDIACYNLGIRANTSTQIRTRWVGECEQRLPDHVDGRYIFMFGLNDMALENTGAIRISTEESIDNARAIMTQAKAQKPTLWLGPTPVRRDGPIISPGKSVTYTFDAGRTKALSGEYAKVAAELEIPYFDMHTVFDGTTGWVQTLDEGDGVHPTGAGYQLIANALTSWAPWRSWLDV